MKNKVSKLLLLISIICFGISTPSESKPKWVKERPSGNEYYIGIASVSKSDINYRETARKKALKEMSAEIEVTISSNSMLRQFENNYQVREEFETQINESVEATLKGYETTSWENRKEYWLMVRISKREYANRKQMELDEAKMRSSSLINEAQVATNKGEIYKALIFYKQAIMAIKEYASEDLSYKTVDGEYNLSTKIFNGIQASLQQVELTADKDKYLISFEKGIKQPLNIKATYYSPNGTELPLKDTPIKFKFIKGSGEINQEATTNNNGEVSCSISKLISKSKSQTIEAKFNLDKVIGDVSDNDKIILDAFFKDDFASRTEMNIELEKQSAYLVMNDVVFGKNDTQNLFTSMVKTELANNFFDITTDRPSADYVITINSNFVKGDSKKGDGYALYLVYANVNVSIVDKNNLEILSSGFSDEKGMKPGSYEYAIKDARNNALNRLKKDILSKID